MMTPRADRLMCGCGVFYLLPATCCEFCEHEAQMQARFEHEAAMKAAHRREVNRRAKATWRERHAMSTRAYYQRHSSELREKRMERYRREGR